MKKNYITPEINVIQLEALCNGGFETGERFKRKYQGRMYQQI